MPKLITPRLGLGLAMAACATHAAWAAPDIQCRVQSVNASDKVMVVELVQDAGRLVAKADGAVVNDHVELLDFTVDANTPENSRPGQILQIFKRIETMTEKARQSGTQMPDHLRLRFAADEIKRMRTFYLEEKPTRFGRPSYVELFGENNVALGRGMVLVFFSPCL